jgi:hypothetical protein
VGRDVRRRGRGERGPSDVRAIVVAHERHAWEAGWISFGVGSGVAVASVLTGPTHAWLLRRRMSERPRVAVVTQLGPDAASLALVGLF